MVGVDGSCEKNCTRQVLTITEIENIAREMGFRVSKERADILEIYFRLNSINNS